MQTRESNRILPAALRGLRHPEQGWTHLWNLAYLGFLFVPVVPSLAESPHMPFAWGPTLLSLLLFLPLFALGFSRRASGISATVSVIGMIALGCGLLPWNAFSNTYIIYAASLIGHQRLPLAWRWLLLAAVLGIFCALLLSFNVPAFVAAITVMISIAAFVGNHYQAERERKRAELKLSHDEVRRIAAFAERERIGRDLHDLLGHTLSVIALKAELASRLVSRDSAAAQVEIEEVARISRETLDEVRRAVSGIRNAALAAELASARLLMEADGTPMDIDMQPFALPSETESALALALREAMTNVHRHAGASRVQISLTREDGNAVLRISDNGRGEGIRAGNGLSGMQERIQAIGGRLEINAQRGHGTRLVAVVPIENAT
ncbi:sensor histidine kinase [Lysobacter sp. HDW10]|uniref:sensor histidine kinase n=1 Tax=Lysobacter sp. HDW10 TaxID=2714936 RepID=UPI00140B60D8|nr:sensor histidine kinase [Lysobacter sp. HDW10]QIK80521.1 sensor histidine kinase [Lysobacter sp. HDW10]